MPDGRKKNGGVRPNAGNPGYGRLEFITNKVSEFSPVWWEKWVEMVHSEKSEDKRFAMTEFNRLQIKMIPQDITTGGKDFTQPILVKFLNESPKDDRDTD